MHNINNLSMIIRDQGIGSDKKYLRINKIEH